MEKKIRLGIIGIGNMGSAHAKHIIGGDCPDFELVAVADTNPDRLLWAKRELSPGICVFEDAMAMLDSGKIDACMVCVPHYFHPQYAIACMERGIHVMVEKPAGVYTKQVREMNETAKKHPEVVFGMMFNQRTNCVYRKMHELVQSGKYGALRRTNWLITTWYRPQAYYDSGDWRATWSGEGGGVLLNQCPHQLDLWQWICGSPIRVTSKNINGAYRDIATENDVTILTEYANGATGCFITCTHDAIGTDRFEIDLSAGKIVIENSAKATIYRMKRSEPELNATMTIRDVELLTKGNASGDRLYDTEVIENVDAWGVQHTAVLENYALAVLTGSPLLAPGTDGIMGVNLANASQLSAWTGKTVDFPVDPEVYAAALNEHIAAEGKYPTRD